MTKSLGCKNKGFTLLEILLVVGIISILAGIIILAINPTKQLGDTRNAQRRSDVLTILNAIYQYSIDNNGALDTINGGTSLFTGECDDGATDAIDLEESLVGTSTIYLTEIPHDPAVASEDIGVISEYYVSENDTTGRITVCAPNAADETNPTPIEVTR